MPTALTSATTTAARTPHRLVLTDPADVQHAADALADGGVVGHGFANVYAITTRPDADIVQRVNHMHDRPTDGPGSITVPPERIPDLFDWTQLPPGLTRRSVLRAVDAFYRSGPFGFRGPAAEHLPPHLTYLEADVMTTLVIAPGYNCPSNDFLARALAAADTDVLHIASANPVRPQPRHHASRASGRCRCSVSVPRLPGDVGDDPRFSPARARSRRSSPAAAARTARIARCRHRAPDARRPRPRPR